jgi:hypothetical protein
LLSFFGLARSFVLRERVAGEAPLKRVTMRAPERFPDESPFLSGF